MKRKNILSLANPWQCYAKLALGHKAADRFSVHKSWHKKLALRAGKAIKVYKGQYGLPITPPTFRANLDHGGRKYRRNSQAWPCGVARIILSVAEVKEASPKEAKSSGARQNTHLSHQAGSGSS